MSYLKTCLVVSILVLCLLSVTWFMIKQKEAISSCPKSFFLPLLDQQKLVIQCQQEIQEISDTANTAFCESETGEDFSFRLPFIMTIQDPIFCELDPENNMKLQLPDVELYSGQKRYVCFSRPECGSCNKLKQGLWMAMCRATDPILAYQITPYYMGETKWETMTIEREILFLPALYEATRSECDMFWQLSKVSNFLFQQK